ncbi:MAG: IMP dehydrogenase [Lentisphaerae bacterium RIFOXYC12_FULL_60_16]|nr:MAG: IMP dehydrogenase [Lentisphaerae bacterium RIFOXYC12_FULL_60_16]OGV84634.1 MAG: IMP dehydrogenase [Lentisphaerae bacterium RIFOXYB12_FULL_60_10]
MDQFPAEGLTFDDVSLLTQYADFLPADADLRSRLTSRINLNIPFVSAAMDTVTEAPMAIAMAMLGGIGVIHKNLTADEQARHVARVKHHLHGMIPLPIVFHVGDTLKDINRRKQEKGYEFNGFPILDSQDRLVGILTSTDIKFARDTDAPVEQIMTSNVITAEPDANLQTAYDLMLKHKIGKLPLVKDGKLVGLYSFTDVKALVEHAHPIYNRDDKYRLRVAAAVSQGDFERVERLVSADVDVIVVDSAHGHSKGILEMVRWITEHYPSVDIIGGNVGTAEGALAVRDAGAHAVKVGIGPGSICTTRVVCGVGVPQVTAVYQASRVLQGSIPVVADGGIRHSGDVPKALVAGADSVMMGSILAATEQSPGEKMIHQGRQYVAYRGMGSMAAMREAAGSRQRYGMDNVAEDDLVPQGIEGIVPYAGPVQKVMTQFCGGLGSSMGYCGCRTIPELQRQGRFIRVSLAGLQESHPHDVKIIKEAPNYRS